MFLTLSLGAGPGSEPLGARLGFCYLHHPLFIGSPSEFPLPLGHLPKHMLSLHSLSLRSNLFPGQELGPKSLQKWREESNFKSSQGRFDFSVSFLREHVRLLPGSLKVRTLAGSAGEPSKLQNFCSSAKVFFPPRHD